MSWISGPCDDDEPPVVLVSEQPVDDEGTWIDGGSGPGWVVPAWETGEPDDED